MVDDPAERLRRCAERAQAKRRKVASLTAELPSATPLSDEEIAVAADPEAQTLAPVTRSKQRHGLTSDKIVSQASQRLLKQEQLGLFTSIPIQAGNEFPTLIARLPIFPPVTEKTQKALLDKDNALPFDTAFGKGRRFGPLLTVRDEDVLQATSRLRSRRLQGRGNQLPIKIQQIFARGANEQYEVHSASSTLKQLCDELEWVKSGPNYKLALQSLRRVNGTVIELEVAKKERYFGPLATRGGGFKLIDIAWDLYREEGIIYCQFNPLVVMWLEKEYTYVNWNVRKQLSSPTARALHRYLSSQPADYKDRLLKIAEAVGIWVPSKKLSSVVSAALDQIVRVGWLSSYELTGTGRSTPKILHVVRATKNR
jgi:hypothetical protein